MGQGSMFCILPVLTNSTRSKRQLVQVSRNLCKIIIKVNLSLDGIYRVNTLTGPPQGAMVLPYMGYIGMCPCEGYGFQAVYSSIGYINVCVWI